MKITEIVVHSVVAPLERAFWMSLEPYTAAAELVVQVRTDAGLTGIGEIHGRPQEQIARIIRDDFAPLLLGQDPLDHERHWAAMFACTHTRRMAGFSAASGQPHFGGGARPQMMAALAGLDIALWDLKGKAAGLPVYRLLGGARRQVPCYASGGYYGPDGGPDVAGLVAEMERYAALGYPAVKMKVGGADLATDVERVAAVRRAVPEVDLMLDANLAYDVPAAIAAARAFEPFGIRWFEEPVHWYDGVFGLAQVSAASRIPTASGESELHRWGCRDLIQHAGIRVMQFDCTRAGGVTEWLRVAAYAAAHGVLMAPHHDPQIHGHLVAAVPNGHVLEVFPNRQRDPLWEDLFTGRPEIRAGVLTVPDRPGFGFDVDERALARYRGAEPVVVRAS